MLGPVCGLGLFLWPLLAILAGLGGPGAAKSGPRAAKRALGTIFGSSCATLEPSWDKKCLFVTFSNTFCKSVFWPQHRFRRHLGTQEAPTWAVKSGQEGPKSGQETLKRSSRSLQSGPRRNQESLRSRQDPLKTPKIGPKRPQDRPKIVLRRPRSAQDRPKRRQDRSKMRQDRAKSGPRAAKRALGTILGSSCGILEPSWDQTCVFFVTFFNTFCKFVFWPQHRFRRHLGSQYAPTWAVKSGQEGPKSGQETLKRSSRSLQSGPRRN